jgi:hypothetical protein
MWRIEGDLLSIEWRSIPGTDAGSAAEVVLELRTKTRGLVARELVPRDLYGTSSSPESAGNLPLALPRAVAPGSWNREEEYARTMTVGGEAAATEESVRQLRVQCAAIGFDLDGASSSLVERMRLLAEHSKTFDDARRTASYAERLFRHYETRRPAAEGFSALERQTVVLACLFSDIGKTGPEDADADGRRLIAEAFAVENVDDDTQPVERFLRTFFPADAELRVTRFAALGLDPSMSVRQFWNLHSGWTLAIVEAAGLPLEAVAAAATHHMLEDINPRAIVGEDDRFTRRFGENATFDRAEKLVILLDKYDAARRRGNRTHAEAIAWLRERIARSSRFHDDEDFLQLLADVDEVIGSSSGSPNADE